MISPFEEELLNACQLFPLEHEALLPPGVAWRALYMPTFHVDCVVEVRHRGEFGELLVIVAAPEFRTWWMERRGWLRPRSELPRPAPDGLTAEVAILDRSQIESLALDMDRLDALGAVDMPRTDGRDGISLVGEARSGGRSCRFTAWSPQAREHPGHHEFFVTLARLAVETLPAERGQRALEACLRYF